MGKEKLVKEITSMNEDFAKWYTDVCIKAELIDYSSVKGCMIIRPYGYAIWEEIQNYLNKKFKKIGVGNVVLNRVNDDTGIFNSTIKSVIFQPGQFSVVESTGIYLPPNDVAVVAAKICLEGYNTVGDSKFFFNPKFSSNKWFEQNRTYVTTIFNHVFYA